MTPRRTDWVPVIGAVIAVIAGLLSAFVGANIRVAPHSSRASQAPSYSYDPGQDSVPSRSFALSTNSGSSVHSLRPTSLGGASSPRIVLVVGAEGEGAGVDAVDPAASRVYLRASTRQAIQDAAPKTAEGDFIDPNTGQVIPQDGPFDYGHQPGYEWWRTQQMAREQGWTRQQVIEYENDPSHYQIEDPNSNRSHLYEMP